MGRLNGTWLRGLAALGIVLGIAACGTDDSPGAAPTPPPHDTPVPATPLPPTWTASPVPPTPTPPTRTPAPTTTPRPSLTPIPPPESGVLQDENRLTITALPDALNAAIVEQYAAHDSPATSTPPVITLQTGGRVQIELAFYNDFLKRSSTVITVVLLRVDSGRIALDEVPDARQSSGALVPDQAVWDGLALVEAGINGALITLSGAPEDVYRPDAVRVYPGYVEADYTAVPAVG